MARPRDRRAFLHPLHALLLAFPIALFTSALVSDLTYLNTAVVQWSHFSAWLLAGAQIFASLVLIWAIVDFLSLRTTGYRNRTLVYLILLAAMWIAGLLNCFQHSRDSWSSVGTVGLVLSILATLLAIGAGWLAYSTPTAREEV